MFIVGILSWWYGGGWKRRIVLLREQMAAIIDYFSIGLLIKSLFSPFRQISAGQVSGSLEVKMRGFADRLISRCIGAMLRVGVIIAGLITIILSAVMGSVTLVVWALAPVMPIIGIVLFAIGWVPWKI